MTQPPEDQTVGGRGRPDGADEARPDRIGRFPVIRRIGRGGMGVVWLGFDEQLRRQVAIKVLPRRVAGDARWIARFEQEATAISALEHPYIVPIHELGVDDGLHYIVMRFIDGDPLDVFVRRLDRPAPSAHLTERPKGRSTDAPLVDDPFAVTTPSDRGSHAGEGVSDPRHASQPTGSGRARAGDAREATARFAMEGNDVAVILAIIEKCAEAIDFAHRHGVLHRDVKPSNIMIDREGNPQILDFGLAKVSGALDVSRTASEGRGADVIGTLPYIAPEVFGGEGTVVDHRADIYALGVTLYECLCGARPFRGVSAEDLVMQVVSRPPTPPTEMRGGISRDLQTVMLKALEKNPDHRYATAADLAADLRNLRMLQDIDARPVTRAVRLGRWASAHPMLALLAVLGLVAAVVLPAVGITSLVRQRAEQRRMESYTAHMKRAEELDGRRRDLKDELAALRQDAQTLERDALPHLAVDHPAKEALFAARAGIVDLEHRIADLTGEIEFELRRSRESVDAWSPPREEGIDFYRRLYVEAEQDGDRAQMAKYRGILVAAGVDAAALAPSGKLTVVTDVPGVAVRVTPCVDRPDGRRLPDASRAVELGRTPIDGATLFAGTWMVELEKEGYVDARFPVLIERDQHWGSSAWRGGMFGTRSWTVPMLRAGSFDEGRWAHVVGGPYLGGPEEYVGLDPRCGWRWVDGFLIARDELTFGEWISFLEDPEISEIFVSRLATEQKLTLLPRRTEYAHPLLGFDVASGAVQLPEAGDCGRDVAVGGISQKDLWIHLDWLKAQGRPARLPHADEWQKAARGVDGRLYPWGDGLDWSYPASVQADPERRMRQYGWPPRSFAADVSPYGVFDMAGNLAEWCADGRLEDDPDLGRWWFAGGAFGYGSPHMFVCWPWNHAPYDYTSELMGARLARDLPRDR